MNEIAQRNYQAERKAAWKTVTGAPVISARHRDAAEREREAPARKQRGQEILEATGLPASATIHSLQKWKEPASQSTKKGGTRRLKDLTPDEVRVLESRYYWAKKVHRKTPEEISSELDLVERDLEQLGQTRRALVQESGYSVGGHGA